MTDKILNPEDMPLQVNVPAGAVTLFHEGYETARATKDGDWEIRVGNGTYVRLNDMIAALGNLQSTLNKMKAELE